MSFWGKASKRSWDVKKNVLVLSPTKEKLHLHFYVTSRRVCHQQPGAEYTNQDRFEWLLPDAATSNVPSEELLFFFFFLLWRPLRVMVILLRFFWQVLLQCFTSSSFTSFFFSTALLLKRVLMTWLRVATPQWPYLCTAIFRSESLYNTSFIDTKQQFNHTTF